MFTNKTNSGLIVPSHWSDLVFTVLEVKKFLLKYMYSALTKSKTVHVFMPKL